MVGRKIEVLYILLWGLPEVMEIQEDLTNDIKMIFMRTRNSHYISLFINLLKLPSNF